MARCARIVTPSREQAGCTDEGRRRQSECVHGLRCRQIAGARISNCLLADLLRQLIYTPLTGYAEVNDAERLSQDPTFRLIGSRKIWGAWGSVDLPLAIVRDRGADKRLESGADDNRWQNSVCHWTFRKIGSPTIASEPGLVAGQAVRRLFPLKSFWPASVLVTEICTDLCRDPSTGV